MIARQAIGKDWPFYQTLLDRWAEIVGADYAMVTTPTKITFPHQPQAAQRTDGTLCVRLPRGLAMEFNFKAETIRQRINSYFGYAAIKKVALDPSAAPARPPATPQTIPAEVTEKIGVMVADVADDDLKTALASFGQALSGSSRKNNA